MEEKDTLLLEEEEVEEVRLEVRSDSWSFLREERRDGCG